MDATFEMNGNAYKTDLETLDILRGIVKAGREANDYSAVEFMMVIGEMGGKIVKTRRA